MAAVSREFITSLPDGIDITIICQLCGARVRPNEEIEHIKTAHEELSDSMWENKCTSMQITMGLK